MYVRVRLTLTFSSSCLDADKRQKTDQVLKDFDLEHIQSIQPDGSWVDCRKGLEFMGRNQFVEEVKNVLGGKLLSPPAKTDIKKATALVYSSVSGSGKTVSMLELKSKLPKEVNNVPVVVAYLGFCTGLELLHEEEQYIRDEQEQGAGVKGAGEVLARRLAAATIISMNNPNITTSLPGSEKVYKGYRIPKVEESKALLLSYASKEKPMYIVAGVDEVQLLNQESQVGNEPKIGLGRIFLRILRYWQYKWHKEGIRLLPLGTGIAIDWSADPTTGMNVPLFGKDTTLIDKEDFQQLVKKVVEGLSLQEFVRRFGAGAEKETVIDLVSASYWPRVRLLEWLRDGDMQSLGNRDFDQNSSCWVTWFCSWLRDEAFSCSNQINIPGKGNKEAKIYSLFELKEGAQKFSVIPDGYTSSSLVAALSDHLPVPGLYENLDAIKSMKPMEFIMEDAYEFEKFGFHVVGTAIHIGLLALKDKGITYASATDTQRRRLGLALWFQDKGAVTHQNGKPSVPKIAGRENSLGCVGDFYPFTSVEQTSFEPAVVEILREAVTKFQPVYIRCGRRTCCDYLYFYVRLTRTHNQAEFICNIDDAKHTNSDDEGCCESVTTADQKGLFNAVLKVHSSFDNAGLVLGDVRLHFVSNRNSLSEQKPDSKVFKELRKAKQDAQKKFPGVQLELLNKATFEFGPFSDILMARRKRKKRKRR